MGSKRACLIQEGTLYGVNKDSSDSRRYFIWGQRGLVRYKKERYMGSARNCMLQEGTLYGVNKDLSDSRSYVAWGQRELV
jgi:hypothetical protein